MAVKRKEPRTKVSTKELYESSPLFRLTAWLALHKAWDNGLSGGRLVQKIENILDLYLAHGASSELQATFNSLAAREPKLGRVTLRLKIKPTNEESALKAFREIQKKAEIKTESGTDREKLLSILSTTPPANLRKQFLEASRPRLVGAINNPLLDLWLTLLAPVTASRLRRCRTLDCQNFFVAWPGKKEFCSDTCRNHFWNRPRRVEQQHRKPRTR